jgi:hypothetical protein
VELLADTLSDVSDDADSDSDSSIIGNWLNKIEGGTFKLFKCPFPGFEQVE